MLLRHQAGARHSQSPIEADSGAVMTTIMLQRNAGCWSILLSYANLPRGDSHRPYSAAQHVSQNYQFLLEYGMAGS